MEEIIDLLDEKGKVIGEVSKEKAHKSGLFHRVVHVWILNDKNQILVQRRAKAKDFYPNVWDVSFAGHIHAGESSLDAALREGKEELGLKLNKENLEYAFTFLDKMTYRDIVANEFADVFILRKNIDLSHLNLQKEELDDVKWLNLDIFFKTCQTSEFLPHLEGYRRLKEYLFK